MQFDTTSHSFNEDMTLEEFLEKHSNSNSQRQTSWATFLEWAAGTLASAGNTFALCMLRMLSISVTHFWNIDVVICVD